VPLSTSAPVDQSDSVKVSQAELVRHLSRAFLGIVAQVVAVAEILRNRQGITLAKRGRR
jgi:hypothetical protein